MSKDGRRLAKYTFGVQAPCNDGRRRGQWLLHPEEKPVRIREGRFNYTGVPGRVSHRLANGSRARGTMVTRFRGHFTRRGRTVRGAIQSTFEGRRLRCRSDWIPYRLDLDGTARAPFRSRNVATGRYSLRGRRIRSGRVSVFLPSRFVSIVARWSAPCQGGGYLRVTQLFPADLRGRLFSNRGRERIKLRGGQRAVSTYRFSGRLFRRRNAYRVSGHLRVTGRVYDGRRLLTTCDTQRNAFRGTFRRGPRDPAGRVPDRAP